MVEYTQSKITTTPNKVRPTPKIVIPEPVCLQHIKGKYRTYKSRALATLLSMQAAQNNHLAMMAGKRRLNLFEVSIKIETTAQNTPTGYELEIIDEEIL